MLTAYDGHSITYDVNGNPLRYYNGSDWKFTWENGRSLATATDGTYNVSYAYDANGLRTAKTVGNVTHNYLYASGQLLRETHGDNTLDFFYDANGYPYALKYNGTTYYYITNLQGDVMYLVDAQGNTVAAYDYDPHGNIVSATGSMADINPLRYRGYYYDAELEMYYLQSRYYDPAIGRFINADDISMLGASATVSGYNLFAYCGNNPIIRIEIGGYLWETIFDVASLCFSAAEVIGDPSDVGAWLGFAGDVIDLVPMVTGVGETVRALRIADKVADGFGGLSKAKKYGIQAYSALRKALKGTGLQAHHIIEQRLVKHLGININKMLSVAVTATEHQKFTNKWREYYKYGMNYSKLTRNDLWKTAQKVYADYPELLAAAKKILFS